MKSKFDPILGKLREDDLNGGVIAVDADFTGDVTIGDASTDTLIINSSVSGPVLFDDGTEAAPSVAFASDTDTGISRAGADELSLIAGGIEGIRIDANELEVQPLMTLATGPIEFEEDSGAVTAMNMPVSSDSSDGDEMSMSLSIDSNPVLKVKASATGTGGADELEVIHLGDIKGLEKSADPVEPAEGEFVIWMSDGTGKGDDGDVLMASKAGGTTNYSVVFDHSAGTTW